MSHTFANQTVATIPPVWLLKRILTFCLYLARAFNSLTEFELCSVGGKIVRYNFEASQ